MIYGDFDLREAYHSINTTSVFLDPSVQQNMQWLFHICESFAVKYLQSTLTTNLWKFNIEY